MEKLKKVCIFTKKDPVLGRKLLTLLFSNGYKWSSSDIPIERCLNGDSYHLNLFNNDKRLTWIIYGATSDFVNTNWYKSIELFYQPNQLDKFFKDFKKNFKGVKSNGVKSNVKISKWKNAWKGNLY